jgi:predicted amino acid racemase
MYGVETVIFLLEERDKMENPKMIIDLEKFEKNVAFLVDKLSKQNLSITAVTKVVCAYPTLMEVFDKFPEIEYFGDSRIENIISYQHSPKKKVLIRIPMHTEIEEVVKYADVSFNSEISTLRLLNEEAAKQGKTHDVLLMTDLGDLREGLFYKEDLMNVVEIIQTELSHLRLVGLGVNLTCYGGIIPDETNLSKLTEYKKEIESTYNIELPMISGGNSSSLYLLDHPEEKLPEGITNLRVGESFYLGRETAYEADYEEMFQDVFTLRTELVELKIKPSYPIGKIGVDAFGNKPSFTDVGPILRGIAGIGKQDISPDAITPIDERIEIIGASSDHLIMDMTKTGKDYQVGSTIDFKVDYGSLLSSFTSKYIKKETIK